jgi:hypothetical protein
VDPVLCFVEGDVEPDSSKLTRSCGENLSRPILLQSGRSKGKVVTYHLVHSRREQSHSHTSIPMPENFPLSSLVSTHCNQGSILDALSR